jgi:hypothetical protein
MESALCFELARNSLKLFVKFRSRHVDAAFFVQRCRHETDQPRPKARPSRSSSLRRLRAGYASRRPRTYAGQFRRGSLHVRMQRVQQCADARVPASDQPRRTMTAHNNDASSPPGPTCKSCGAPTRLEEVAWHPDDALAHLIYRCTVCAALIVSAGPRQRRPKVGA